MSIYMRDTTFGQLIRLATGNKVLLYPEEREDFKLPDYLSHTTSRSSSRTAVDALAVAEKKPASDAEKPADDADLELAPVRAAPVSVAGTKTQEGYILIDWYGTDDPVRFPFV